MDNDYFDDDFEEILDDGSSLDDSQVIYTEPPKKSNTSNDKNIVQRTKEKKDQIADKTGKTIENTGKGISTAGKTVKGAGKGVQTTGKGVEVAGKGAQVAGKGMQAAGKGIETTSNAVGSALSAIPYVGGVLGGVTKGAGKAVGGGLNIAGKGAEKFGEAAEKGGSKMQESGKKMQDSGKKIDEKGRRVSEKGRNVRNRSNDSQSRIRNSNNKSSVPMHNSSSAMSNTSKIKKRVTEFAKDIKTAFKPLSLSLEDNVRKIKIFVIGFFLLLFILAIIIFMIFSPVLDVVQKISEKWESVKLTTEKTSNLYTGFGYESTKDAFYKEVDYLYEDYDEQLDLSLLMATLFYKEREGYNTQFGEDPPKDDGIDGIDIASLSTAATKFLMSEYKSMFESLDEDGKKYTIGKIYRLRKLARNQLDTSLFGNGGLPTEEEEVPLSEFIDRVQDRMSSDVYQALEAAPSALEVLNPFNYAKKVYEILSVSSGDETLSTTSFTNDNEATLSIKKLLKESVITGVEFGNIRFDLSSRQFMVTIYKYEQNIDNYKQYLHDYYIPNMPEFKEELIGLKGEKKEQKINDIIDDIYEYSDQFNKIFGYSKEESAGDYSEACVGNVNQDLVSAIKNLPVKGNNYNFDGANAYGISNGTQNNGLNLTETTSGVKEGDSVYSIYGGKVINVKKNIKCNTSDDETCDAKGNYVEIKHDAIRVNGSTFKITTFYSNLKSVKVKKNETIKAGQVIGTVGQTGDATEPMVHFEMYDTDTKQYLNTTNLFIPCTENGGLVDGANDVKIWCYLTRNLGYPKGKAAGTIANLNSESGLDPQRVEGRDHAYSKQYTEKVDSNKISKNVFVNTYSGYGLAQWTSAGRKENLYNNVKKVKTTSIGDLEAQLNFFKKEIENPSAWTKRYNEWKNAGSSLSDAKTSTIAMMEGYERPRTPHLESRLQTAHSVYNKFKNHKCQSTTNMNNLSQNNGNGVSNERQKIVEYAKSFVGHPYKYGGNKLCTNWRVKSGCAVDCSSFMQNIFKHFGYNISRSTSTQIRDGEEITESQLKPGDIIIYGNNGKTNHVAMYIGNNSIVHASNPKDGVKISSNYKYKNILSFRRIIKD